MPEFEGRKITRQEEKVRHAYRRALNKATRAAAKGTGWRCSDGMLFRELGGWFFHSYPAVWIVARETHVALHVKPMAIDPIFWNVVKMPENNHQALSFRGLGAWVCRTPPIEEATIQEFDMDAEEAAGEFVRWTMENAQKVRHTLTLERFVALLDGTQRPGPFNPYLATKISALILMNQPEEARRLSTDALERGDVGGFMSEGGFPEMALGMLDAPNEKRSLH